MKPLHLLLAALLLVSVLSACRERVPENRTSYDETNARHGKQAEFRDPFTSFYRGASCRLLVVDSGDGLEEPKFEVHADARRSIFCFSFRIMARVGAC